MTGIRVELSRLWHRRAIRIIVAVALLGVLAALGFALKDAVPPSAAKQAAAQAQVDQQLNDPEFQQMLRECRDSVANQHDSTADAGASRAPTDGEAPTAGAASAGAAAEPVPTEPAGVVASSEAEGGPQYPQGFNCDDLGPKVEWYLDWQKPDLVRDFANNLQAVTLILAVLFTFCVITFLGADFSSGTIGTQLLYRPRRTGLLSAKAAAVALSAVVIGALGAALAWAESYFAASRWGTTEMVDKIQHYTISGSNFGSFTESVDVTGWTLVGWCLRAVALVALAAWGGFALATLFRSSMIATAVLAAYGILGEAVVANLLPALQPYLLRTRIAAWLHGPYTLVQWPNTCSRPDGCPPTLHTVSVAGGGIYLAILVAVGMLLAGWAFARRDVE